MVKKSAFFKKIQGKNIDYLDEESKREDETFWIFFSDIMCENIWADPHFSHIGEKIEETVTNLVTVKKDFNLHYCCHEEFQIWFLRWGSRGQISIWVVLPPLGMYLPSCFLPLLLEDWLHGAFCNFVKCARCDKSSVLNPNFPRPSSCFPFLKVIFI